MPRHFLTKYSKEADKTIGMRITGGLYRGRNIICPKGIIRPAMDRMRESVFAILHDISEVPFLDLFSGSGVIGIEAASRGAEPVVLVEKDYKKKPVLLQNISFVTSDIRPLFMPAERFIRTRDTMQFGYIFLDPPFAYRKKQELLKYVAVSRLCSDGSTVMIHHPSSETMENDISYLHCTDRRVYGGSTVTFYVRNKISDQSSRASV